MTDKMTDKLFMSPNNGEVVVGIPLFKTHNSEEIPSFKDGYYIFLTNSEPLAYILDAGSFNQIVSAEWANKYLINLGNL